MNEAQRIIVSLLKWTADLRGSGSIEEKSLEEFTILLAPDKGELDPEWALYIFVMLLSFTVGLMEALGKISGTSLEDVIKHFGTSIQETE